MPVQAAHSQHIDTVARTGHKGLLANTAHQTMYPTALPLSGNFSAINVLTNQFNTIKGVSPVGIAVLPGEAQVYVANSGAIR